ncbi:ATP-binding cassette domain-containing protein [Nocardioides sp. B-3]|uniref:ATP-binding cassette domain-containing protein n=1 Tax=Nocardioides sp. B-3 TaxID=2895565 RepID=UPI0021533845|nr:ATP-binding cassette domain-containing protein [Nocardioides sp. B-3]UUZ58726.1 ATP-binding cassette domain-containing protein [Nocardioides sp. B-3]
MEFRDLEFSYGTGSFALRDVDLLVPAGHTCALVGRTGSGKSTPASLLSRAVEPPRGTVLLGGTDVRDLDLQQLRAAVGVVTQRTEVLAGTLAENVTLFDDVPRATVEAAIAELGLTDWVAGLPVGLDTVLGPGGTSLSAGEEQLVAFARLLVRDVSVVVLDEATARMDPVTEARVVRAADRLISGRTGILVAHRLSTTERAERVAVPESGRIVQQGPRGRLATEAGPFRTLLDAAAHEAVIEEHHHDDSSIGSVRRSTTPPPPPVLAPMPSLSGQVLHTVSIQPQWGLVGAFLFLIASLTGAFGAVTGWIWGHIVTDLQAGERPTALAAALVVSPGDQPAAALAGLPHLPALVGGGAAAGPRGRAARADVAAPARAHPARRGRGPHHGRRPARPLHRPLGGFRQRARRRGRDRADRRHVAGGRGADHRDGRVGAGLDHGAPGRRSVGRRRLDLARRLRPVPGLRPRVGPHRQAGGGDAAGPRPPARGRQRARRRGGARASRAGAARRRARRDGAVRGRRRVGRSADR